MYSALLVIFIYYEGAGCYYPMYRGTIVFLFRRFISIKLRFKPFTCLLNYMHYIHSQGSTLLGKQIFFKNNLLAQILVSCGFPFFLPFSSLCLHSRPAHTFSERMQMNIMGLDLDPHFLSRNLNMNFLFFAVLKL